MTDADYERAGFYAAEITEAKDTSELLEIVYRIMQAEQRRQQFDKP